jgi:hypothetical protein
MSEEKVKEKLNLNKIFMNWYFLTESNLNKKQYNYSSLLLKDKNIIITLDKEFLNFKTNKKTK